MPRRNVTSRAAPSLFATIDFRFSPTTELPSWARSRSCASFPLPFTSFSLPNLSQADTDQAFWHDMSSLVVVRQARLSDLDCLTEICLAAMPMDPQWDWRFPFRKDFPEDTFFFTRAKYLEFLENTSGYWRVMVAELQSPSAQAAIPIAFAVWDVRNVKKLQSRSLHRQLGLCLNDLQ